MAWGNGYGTVPSSGGANDVLTGNPVDEQQPFLLSGQKKTRPGGLRRRLMVDISRDWADVVLILCYLITGLLDSASTSIWGSFVSMQTGNTVFIGLGIAAPSESDRWKKSLASLGCFCLGAFAFSRFHAYFLPKRRWVFICSFLFQFILILASAAMVTFRGDKETNGELDWRVLVPIALVAFQSSGQAVASRVLRYKSLTSVVLTSVYCDLFMDPFLFGCDNPERNRRLAAPVTLLVGSVAGGLFSHSSMGIAGALWAAAALKLLAVFAWLLWPAKRSQREVGLL